MGLSSIASKAGVSFGKATGNFRDNFKKGMSQSQEQPHSQIPNATKNSSSFAGYGLVLLVAIMSFIFLPVFVALFLTVIVFLSVKLGWFRNFKFWKIIITVVILLIVYFILSYLGILGIVPAWGSFLGISTADTQTQLENIGLWNVIKDSLRTTFKTIQDPTTIYTETPTIKAEVEQNANNQQLGLKVKSFSPISQIYFPDEEIQLGAQVLASSLENDAQVLITCQVPNPQKNSDIDKINNAVKIDPPGQPYKLTKGQINLITLTCTYPAGTFKLKTSDTLISQKVELLSSYEFKTMAFLDVFTLPYTAFQTYLTPKGIAYNLIFANENTQLKQEGKTISTYTYGPMKLALELKEPQPLTERGPTSSNPYYTLDVQLAKSSSMFTGRLKELKQLKIKIPENLEVSETSLQRESTEGGLIVYRLTDAQIKTQNERFSNPNILDPKLGIWFKVKVNQLNKESLEKTFILAEVIYVYEDKYSTNVKIAKRTEETNEASIT